jgi:phenylalanyl-tRNA synthetase beta chain
MKVSLNWIRYINQQYGCAAEPAPEGIDNLVERIGAQLGAVEEVVDLGRKYQNLIIVKVVVCKKHPNADKLSVCLIDDGGVVKKVKRNKDGLVEVVCGAPNVRSGMLAVWIPPGSAVPSTLDKKPLVLETLDIRGVSSSGMLASASELDIGDDHNKIVEIDEPAKEGDDFAKVYQLDDYIIDIENKMFTHRPDCFGMLGVAREIAGIQQMVFRSPKWYLDEKTASRHRADDKLLSVQNLAADLAPRFMMQVVKNVRVNDSSLRLQSYLSRVGLRPVNNIVDITNYLMLETAQPIHAYDYDKVQKLSKESTAKIVVRKAKRGETLIVLGGKKVQLTGQELVIAAGKKPIGLAGVIGGAATEVDRQTKNIILEVGNFDMRVIRKTAMEHGLFTEAAVRFTKDQSPWQTDKVLARAVEYVISQAGGLAARSIYDIAVKLRPLPIIDVDVDFINQKLGLKLSASTIAKLLENVEFKVQIRRNLLNIKVPFWRSDIKIPEDIVEEVGRLYGYEHLPLTLPMRDLTPTKDDRLLSFKSKLRNILLSAGANELLNYSFVDSSLLKKVGQDASKAFHIRNALSPSLQYYRLSLMPSLLDKVHANIKAGHEAFVIYELGKVHIKGMNDNEDLPAEPERLSLVVAAKKADRNSGAPFYIAKKYAQHLFKKLGIDDVQYLPLKKTELAEEWKIAAALLDENRSAVVMANHQLIGIVGEPASLVGQNLKLPSVVSGLELDVNAMLAKSSDIAKYQPLNRYPKLDQDICLRTNAEKSYAQLTAFIKNELMAAARKHGYGFDVYPIDIFQRPNDKLHKQTTWRIKLWHPERTLKTEEINQLLDKMAEKASKELGAERI